MHFEMFKTFKYEIVTIMYVLVILCNKENNEKGVWRDQKNASGL